jgi:putative Ig domain-containing protein
MYLQVPSAHDLGDLSRARLDLLEFTQGLETFSPPQIVYRGSCMSSKIAGFSEISQKSSHASILRLLLAVFCCAVLGACSPSLQNSAASAGPMGGAIAIQPSLSGASVGQAYSAVLSVSGGVAPYNFAVTQGTLPPGLTLNSKTGNISGVASQAGTFQFTISVTSSLGAGAVLGRTETSGDSGWRGFTMSVTPCETCVTVQISPANPSVAAGATIQFGAIVSNTSNPAVTWSANAGTISSNGLFVAPTNTSTKSVQIVATSVAQPTANATTTATITANSSLKISTTFLPPASSGLPYTTTLSATGGSLPYQWSVASGSLPSGLALNSTTGAISGTPTQAGTTAFTVSVSDATTSAQQSLSLVVGTVTAGPNYSRARQDVAISQPLPIPNVGGLTGAGTCVTPSDFGLPICRLTDSTWDPSTSANGNTFIPVGNDNHNWSCNNNFVLFGNTNGLGYVGALSYRQTAPYVSMSHLYPANPSWSTHGGWYADETSGGWSWNCASTPNKLYLKNTISPAIAIQSYDFTGYATNPGGAPVTATVFDFRSGQTGSWGTTSANCLPSTATLSGSNWSELFSPTKSPADGAFEMAMALQQSLLSGVDTISIRSGSNEFAISGPTPLDASGHLTNAWIVIGGTQYAIATVNSGGMSGTLTTSCSGTCGSGLSVAIPSDQNSGFDIAVYKQGSGCAHLNTATGAITSDFGVSGTMSTTDRFYIHGARISPDGTYVFISLDICVTGFSCNSTEGYIWNTSTLSVVPLCAVDNQCGGHNADGFTHIVNAGSPIGQMIIRPYGNEQPYSTIIPEPPLPPTGFSNCTAAALDTHNSWQDVDTADSYPVIISSTAFTPYTQLPGSYNCPLVNEIYGVNPRNGTIYRFAHNFITGSSWNYVLQNGMGSLSNDGAYQMFGSDWTNSSGVGTLGRFDLASGSCVNSPSGASACRGDVFVVNLTAAPVF